MRMKEEREFVVEYGKKLVTAGLTKGTGGNISVFERRTGLMAISPSGLSYFETRPEDVVVLDVEDYTIIESDRKPSSEFSMHGIFYRKREDIDAVVHIHSTYATVLASLRQDLPAISYLVAYAGHDVRCAKYASFGTTELAENAFGAMRERNAVLLANHGLLAGSQDIHNAFNIAEQIEFCCEIYHKSKIIGEPVLLELNEMDRMIEEFKTYGQI